MLVRKFGGTSVKDATAIKRTVEIIKNCESQQIIVVSALSGITNLLVLCIENLKSHKIDNSVNNLEQIRTIHLELILELKLNSSLNDFVNITIDELIKIINALDIIGEISNKSKDKILATGEIFSSYIIAEYANSILGNVKHINSTEIIKTDSNYSEAEVDFEITENLIADKLNYFQQNCSILICGGFIGSDKYGSITTLGRGGSDYSAAVIAKCVKAESLEIWKDVDGILTSDPRMINSAKLLKEISYKEAAELAYFGAKVLHPKTIYPAIEEQIPVYVLNSYKPNGKGTLIKMKSDFGNMIKAIAFRKNITIINVTSNRMLGAYGFLAKVFDVFLMNETSVDLVTTSEVSISLTIDNDRNLASIISDLNSFASIEIYENKAIISAVGEGVRDTSGIAARFFGALNGVNISMISMGASEVNLSIIIAENELEKAVKLLHSEFFENQTLPELFIELTGNN
jgi:aspartate kinase